jgi:nicotinamidase/pyrazinamidase
MSDLFWDVDTQKDFMNEDGNLFVDGAEEIKDNLADLTALAERENIPVAGSLDAHTKDDEELSDEPDFETTFPPHCLDGTDGFEKIEETRFDHRLVMVPQDDDVHTFDQGEGLTDKPNLSYFFKKNRFDVSVNPNFETAVKNSDIDNLFIYGVTLDVCVSFAVDAFTSITNVANEIVVVEDATRAIDPSTRDDILTDWRDTGIATVTTEEVVDKLSSPANV